MYRFVYAVIAGFLLGVVFRSYFDWGIAPPLFLGVAAVGALVVTRARMGLLLCVLCLACGFGVVRTELALRALEPYPPIQNETLVQAEGVVVREPDVRNSKTLVILDLYEVDERPAKLRVRASVPTYPELSYGDQVSVKGELMVPTEFVTDTGRVFDYPNYLKKEGVHYELRYPELTILGTGQGSFITGSLLNVKHIGPTHSIPPHTFP